MAVSVLAVRVFSQSSNFPIGKKVQVQGELREEPRLLGQSQYFEIKGVFVRTERYPEYHFGDRLKIQGDLKEKARLDFPKIEKVGESKGIFPLIFDVRRNLIQKSQRLWSEPISSLISGLVLGNNSMSQEFSESLRKTGTLHIVVVSGQNVTILAGFIFLLASRLPKRLAIISVIASISLYTILSGLQPPAVRAAIMGSLAYGAQSLGREKLSLWGLFLAAFAMIFFSPGLLGDISFQLSFAATLGILLLSPLVMKNLRLPQFLRENLIVTLSAWIFSAPLIAYYFSQFTPITPVSNLLVLPFVPLLMILGAFAIILSQIVFVVGQILAMFTLVPALVVSFLIEKMSQIPNATIDLNVSAYLVTLYYVLLGIVILWLWKHRSFPQK